MFFSFVLSVFTVSLFLFNLRSVGKKKYDNAIFAQKVNIKMMVNFEIENVFIKIVQKSPQDQ